MVIATLNNYEMGKLISRLGSAKYAPLWSEPCRVIRFCNRDESVAVVQSVWHRGLQKQVPVGQLRAIPSTLGLDSLNAAKVELIAEYRRTQSNLPECGNLKQHLERVPIEQRGRVADQARALSTELGYEDQEIIVDVPIPEDGPSQVDDGRKRRRKTVTWDLKEDDLQNLRKPFKKGGDELCSSTDVEHT